MQNAPYQRAYILLRPLVGEAAGVARMEGSRGRYGIHIHARRLPDTPVRALLLAGDVHSGAVTDLGLLHTSGEGQAVLSREEVQLQGWVHTLALASDWPHAQLLMCGWVRSRAGCTLWQVQEMVQRYLAVPAPGSAPAPAEEPPKPEKSSVLRLRERVST